MSANHVQTPAPFKTKKAAHRPTRKVDGCQLDCPGFCGHILGALGLKLPDGSVAESQGRVCCHCGTARVIYKGINESGHGPHAVFVPADNPPPSPLILADAGVHLPPPPGRR